MTQKRRVGILQPGHAPEGLAKAMGDYDRCFLRLLGEGSYDYAFYDVEAGEIPASVREADGWLITGSRHGVYEDHAWLPGLQAFVREAVSSHVPLVGICFGHQLVAQALGGEVARADIGWIAGPQRYENSEGPALTLNAWHRDQVVKAPLGASVFLSNAACPIAGFRLPGVLTFQPHPEFDQAYADGLLKARGAALPEALQATLPDLIAGSQLSQAQVSEMILALL